MQAGDNYTVLNHISATEYLNYDGDKFSKGRGIGVFGNQCWETTIPADIWRYYLFMIRPESSDSNFAWNDLEQKSNNELLANIGNLYNRLLQFAFTKFDKKVPQGSEESFTGEPLSFNTANADSLIDQCCCFLI
jgi:methionyl-tRNA synthetase